MNKTARSICEDILRENIRCNTENEVLPSESAVAERLLGRGEELAEAYDEIYSKLCRRTYALHQFMGMLLSAQALWNPEKIAKAREDRDVLKEVNAKIEKQARVLADLLQRRTELNNTSGFSSETLYHIVDVIDRANEGNGHYATFLRKPLQGLCGQYDLKYWPELFRCLHVIADDAANAIVEATDPMTDAATASRRPSTSDSVMLFLAYIDECRGNYDGGLPRDFHLSDKNMATVMNILLDLPRDKILTAEYIKGRRQKARGGMSRTYLKIEI